MDTRMRFSDGQRVEFVAPAACRLLFPETSPNDPYPRTVRVVPGMLGSVFIHDAIQTLPGDVSVKVWDPNRATDVVIAARLGIVVAVEFEEDPETGKPAFKVYRNAKVAVEEEPEATSDEEDD